MTTGITAANITVTLDVGAERLVLLEEAVEKAAHPGWTPAESAMTKVAARSALESIKSAFPRPASLSYFDWTVLQGELARLAVQERGRRDLLIAWMELRDRASANPEVRRLLAVVDATEEAARRVDDARRGLEDAMAELRARERDHELLSDPDPEYAGMTRDEGDAHRREERGRALERLSDEALAEAREERAGRLEG